MGDFFLKKKRKKETIYQFAQGDLNVYATTMNQRNQSMVQNVSKHLKNAIKFTQKA